MAVDRKAHPKLSVGNLLLGLTMDRAARHGIRTYDFLRGAEDYKLEWADGVESCLDFLAYRPGLAVTGHLALAGLRTVAKSALR